MIRVAVASSQIFNIKEVLESFFVAENIAYQIVSYHKQNYQDIYIFEIENQEDLKQLTELSYSPYSLYYVIGPEDYNLTKECIRLKVDLYFSKNNFLEEFHKYKCHILQDIQERFQYYEYQRNGMSSQIRLSHIYYVESLRHSIIIHSVNGTFVERKNLKDFLKHTHSSSFIQIHKSFIVNKQWIQKISSTQILLKNTEILQIGRAYKHNVQSINDFIDEK